MPTNNPTIQVLHHHVSVRDFTDRQLTDAERSALLEAARASSSSCFLQVVTIIRVTDPELREKISHLAGEQPQIRNAPEFWVFCADYHRDHRVCGEADLGWTEQLMVGCTDSALMAQNTLTAAEALGMGGCFIGGIRTNIEAIGELLGLPQHVIPVVGLTIGFPAKKNDLKPRLPVDILCVENTYQEPSQEALAAYDETFSNYYHDRDPSAAPVCWKTKLDPILARERRTFMRDYLMKQGFNLK